MEPANSHADNIESMTADDALEELDAACTNKKRMRLRGWGVKPIGVAYGLRLDELATEGYAERREIDGHSHYAITAAGRAHLAQQHG